MLDRRRFLGGLAAASAGLALPRAAARAAGEPSGRRFVFVQALGGWDVTRVFAPVFGSADVQMEAEAEPLAFGDLEIVAHPGRPNVTRFFEDHAASTALIHGLYVASVAHPSAIRLLLTSSLDAAHADWATRIAAAAPDDPVLPHLVVGGLYYAGQLGVHVGRAGSRGQLQGLSSGEIVGLSDQVVPLPQDDLEAEVDAWLAGSVDRALAASGTDSRSHKLDAFSQALERAGRVKGMSGAFDFSGGEAFSDQAAVAVEALAAGVSRCVTLSHPTRDAQVSWDSHAINESTQSALFDALFRDVGDLMARLRSTPSGDGTLADETVVVVVSEMARTPRDNGSNGRDHWPCTSAMIVGPGIAGGRMAGGYDQRLYGRPADLQSGDPTESGEWLGPEHLGATLLALAGLDARAEGVPADPIEGLLA